MPHYKDGTEARVGDQVTGHLYNTPGVVAGTIISITPGTESCNAMVQFTIALRKTHLEAAQRTTRDGGPQPAANLDARGCPVAVPQMAVYGGAPDAVLSREVKGRNHGSEGDTYVLFTCADYCAVNELSKVG